MRVGALAAGESEAVGEADPPATVARGVAGKRGVRREQADAETGDRLDGGAQAAFSAGRTSASA